jgi:MerR family mercuric resistance operon transcriptional regulator
MESLKIGQLAQRAGVGVETIRFYEREGLIAEPPRRPSGYRDYPPETVTRIVFIRRAKQLGFSLKEIGELLDLRVRPRRNCTLVKQSADAKIVDIDTKIAALRRMRRALIDLTKACDERTTTTECPILASLDSAGKPAVGR